MARAKIFIDEERESLRSAVKIRRLKRIKEGGKKRKIWKSGSHAIRTKPSQWLYPSPSAQEKVTSPCFHREGTLSLLMRGPTTNPNEINGCSTPLTSLSLSFTVIINIPSPF
ncbi:hypothetical protein AAC387_Pa09g2264 [Persea americana]